MIYKVEEVSAGLCTGTLRAGAIEAKINKMEKNGWKFEQTETVIGRCCLIFQRYKTLICFSKESEILNEDSASIQGEEFTTSENTGYFWKYLYLLGMLITTIGFCCPMFKGFFGSGANGFNFINFENGEFVTIGALLIFIGAVVGLAYAVLPMLGIKLPSSDLVKTVAVIASIAGGIVLVICFQDNAISKAILKNATYGSYMIIVGWVLALVGNLKK